MKFNSERGPRLSWRLSVIVAAIVLAFYGLLLLGSASLWKLLHPGR